MEEARSSPSFYCTFLLQVSKDWFSHFRARLRTTETVEQNKITTRNVEITNNKHKPNKDLFLQYPGWCGSFNFVIIGDSSSWLRRHFPWLAWRHILVP